LTQEKQANKVMVINSSLCGVLGVEILGYIKNHAGASLQEILMLCTPILFFALMAFVFFMIKSKLKAAK
jgi:hypothetical protein